MDRLRFATWTGIDLPDTPEPTPDTLAALENAATALKSRGAKSGFGGPPKIKSVDDILEAAWDPREIVPDPEAPLPDFILDQQAVEYFTGRLDRISNERRISARTELLPSFQRSWLSFLEKVDVILAPVCSCPAMKHQTTWQNISAFNYTLLISLLPKVPAGSVQFGRSKNGLPIGIQVIVAPYREDIAFAVMKCLEESAAS